MNKYLTVIIPAYNEEASIADTIRSIQHQTTPPDKIIVVDDCSTDRTAEVAKSLGVSVLRPAQNTGSKAGAQTFALRYVQTPLVMAIDGDTILVPNAIERLLPSLYDKTVVAACGFVLPRYVKSIWERGRYIEYLLAFSFYKPIQNYYGKPLISSGCFSVYRTAILRRAGGWSNRTLAEDMDLTWTFYQMGGQVRFVPEALCYPIEPNSLLLMRKQLKRWSHGFIQNVRLHWRGVIKLPYLPYVITVGLWDAVVASLIFLIAIPLLAILISPWFLLGYIIDAPVLLIPILPIAFKRREICRMLISFPAYFVLRLLNALMMLKAMWLEFIMRRPFEVYEKGH